MKKLLFSIALLTFSAGAMAEEIGSVKTSFKLVGNNDRIIIEAFDDPKVEGVSCHLSRAKKGGASEVVGLSEDTSDASISCRQVGDIKMRNIKDGEEVFSERSSALFKKIKVARFYDKKRNVLIYLVYSNRLIEGSPKNNISSVPIMSWNK